MPDPLKRPAKTYKTPVKPQMCAHTHIVSTEKTDLSLSTFFFRKLRLSTFYELTQVVQCLQTVLTGVR